MGKGPELKFLRKSHKGHELLEEVYSTTNLGNATQSYSETPVPCTCHDGCPHKD
jgi:hypothetical protein